MTSESDNGYAVSSGRIQAGKRGIIGRSFYDDGELVFEAPYVAVKR